MGFQKSISFYKDVYETVEEFKQKNKHLYSTTKLRNLAYEQVINKYQEQYPSLAYRKNKYVGEWLTRYKRMSGILQHNNNQYITDNKMISYGLILSTLFLKNPFEDNVDNNVCTLPGYQNAFKFERLLLRKIPKVTKIICLENNKKLLDKILELDKPKNIDVVSIPINLEDYLKNYPLKGWFNFIWADFCSVSSYSDFEDIILFSMKKRGVFAITETQRQYGEFLKYRFNPNPKYFEILINYTYQPSNMILKIYQIKNK